MNSEPLAGTNVPYFTTADDCRIFYSPYSLDDSDPVVIFLNGTTQTTLYWGAFAPSLKRRFGLMFYDARGQGQSELGTTPISLNLHVSDLHDLIGFLDIDRAHLVGISHGARLALEFSLQFPQVVDHLVLCSLSAQTSARCRAIVRSWLEVLQLADLKAMAWAALPTVFGNKFLEYHQKILDKIVAAVVVRNDKKALMAQLQAVLTYPPPVNIPADFNIPTLLLSGSEDPLVEPADVHRLAHLCRARHEVLADIGHSIPAEAPQLFENLVLEFFNSGA